MEKRTKRVLVVVDYQIDFVSGSLGFLEAAAIEEAVCTKIQEYKSCQDDVVYTLDTHYHDYLQTQEGKKLPVSHCIWETEGWQLYGKVKELLKDDPFFEKNTFGSIDLMNYLEENEFEEVELVGLVTNICVVANAVLAKTALPEAEIIVDAACIAGIDPVLNDKTLDVMEGLQITVRNRG